MEFVSTKCGNASAIYQGYRYSCKSYKTGVKCWSCIKRDTCKSRLVTKLDGEFVSWTGELEHPPDVAKREVETCHDHMRAHAREEVTPMPQIYTEVTSELTRYGLELVTNVPSLFLCNSQKWP